ncbi:MAG TPA: hypothetical protein VGC11_05145 [Acidimicrobiia bacterium]|jgi:hypothetical protein
MTIDIAGFITYLKDHAVEHGFHIHDERHFLETYSLRQSWEVELHPESACDGPLDLILAFEVDPRVVLDLEERLDDLEDDDARPQGEFPLPLSFNWALPPMMAGPDLVVLAAEMAGIGGVDLPIEVSGVSSTGALSTGPEYRLSITGRVEISLVDAMLGEEKLCDTLERCRAVSEFLVAQAEDWKVVYPEEPF